MKPKNKILLIITLYTFLIIPNLSISAQNKCKKTEVVFADVLVGEKVEKTVDFNSFLYPETQKVTSPVDGKVTAIKISVGDVVSKGVELIIIDDALADEIKVLEGKVKEWEKKLRAREHWKVRSKRAERQAKSNIEKYKKLLNKKKEEALNYIIKSEYSGVVKNIMVTLNENVKRGDSLIEIEDLKKVFFDINVDYKMIESFKKGESFVVEIQKGDEIIRKKAIVARVLDNRVVFSLNNEGNNLKGGMKVNLSVTLLKKNNAVVVSESVIQRENGSVFAYVPEFYKKKILVKKVPLEIEEYREGKFIVEKGLKPRDLVIKSGFKCLYPGKEIKILVVNPQNGRYMMLSKAKDLKKIESLSYIPVKKEEKKSEKNKKEKKEIKKEKTKEVKVKVEKRKEKVKIEEKKEVKKEKREAVKKWECKLSKIFKLNKSLLGFEKIKEGFISTNQYKIILSGKHLDVKQIVNEVERHNYKYFCVENLNKKMKFTIVIYRKKIKGVKVRKKEVIKEMAERIEVENRFGVKIGGGTFLTKNNDFENISQSLIDKGINPVPSTKTIMLFPEIEFLYKINNKIGLSLDISRASRTHDLSGTYTEKVTDDFTSEYNINMFNLSEKYTFLRTKLNYLLWEREGMYKLSVDVGGGMYFGGISKEKNLKYALKRNTESMYSYDYSETIDASSSGFLFTFGTNFNISITSNIEAFTSIGMDYLLKSKWSGTYTYSLPKDTTMEGNLYFVEYNGLKYLWVLDDNTYDKLIEDDKYKISEPGFITGRGNFRVIIGIFYKF